MWVESSRGRRGFEGRRGGSHIEGSRVVEGSRGSIIKRSRSRVVEGSRAVAERLSHVCIICCNILQKLWTAMVEET